MAECQLIGASCVEQGLKVYHSFASRGVSLQPPSPRVPPPSFFVFDYFPPGSLLKWRGKKQTRGFSHKCHKRRRRQRESARVCTLMYASATTGEVNRKSKEKKSVEIRRARAHLHKHTSTRVGGVCVC